MKKSQLKNRLKRIIQEELRKLKEGSEDNNNPMYLEKTIGSCPPCPATKPCCYSLGSTTGDTYCDVCDEGDEPGVIKIKKDHEITRMRELAGLRSIGEEKISSSNCPESHQCSDNTDCEGHNDNNCGNHECNEGCCTAMCDNAYKTTNGGGWPHPKDRPTK